VLQKNIAILSSLTTILCNTDKTQYIKLNAIMFNQLFMYDIYL